MFFVALSATGAPAMAADRMIECAGLKDAAHVLSALYGQPFNFEGVPLARGVELDLEEVGSGQVVGSRRFGGLEFVIRDESSPADAAQAAVEAWNARGGPGVYKVVESRGMLHFVPTRRRLDASTSEAWTSPMDLTIDLGVTEGGAPELFELALARLGEALGEPIADGNQGTFMLGKPRTLEGFGPYPSIKLDSSSGKARDIFDQILERAGGQESHWSLGHVVWHVPDDPREEYWNFTWLIDNARLDRHVRDVP